MDYAPFTNPVALEAASWQFGDAALASSHGTSAVVSGADSAQSAHTAFDTPPETKKSSTDIGSVLDFYLKDVGERVIGKGSGDASLPWYERHSTLLWSVVLVVLGLFMFSRGLGLIGEGAEDSVETIGNPSKYPGIGHAIQAMKKNPELAV